MNRRQFFRNFWKRSPIPKRSSEERWARRQALESHVQRELLPEDFALTRNERAQLDLRVRVLLEQSTDEDLFSPRIHRRLNQLVEGLVDAFRMASNEVSPHKVPSELRAAAIHSVTLFLKQTEDEKIDALMARLALSDRNELEEFLRSELKKWVEGISDHDVLKYDRISIQDPAISRLRTLLTQDPRS